MNGSGHPSNANDLDAQNKHLVTAHFDDLMNKRDFTAVDRNMAEDFLDHNGPGARVLDVQNTAL